MKPYALKCVCVSVDTASYSFFCLFSNSPFPSFYPLPTEGDETGVMDSLMEALQSGAAFRDRRKRTPRNGE